MNKVGLDYGTVLGGIPWTHTLGIRTHYKLNERNLSKVTDNLIRMRGVDALFCSIEPDRDKHNHAHLLLLGNSFLDAQKISQATRINRKAIWLDEVEDPEAVSFYCTKYVGKKGSYHDIQFDRGLTFNDFGIN